MPKGIPKRGFRIYSKDKKVGPKWTSTNLVTIKRRRPFKKKSRICVSGEELEKRILNYENFGF